MTVHLIKLCAGAGGIEDLEERIARSLARNRKSGRGAVHIHETRMFPRRRDELLDGGSIYWVIKGVVLARQRILGLDVFSDENGVERCAISLEPKTVQTDAQPRRAFQGWRYLKVEDAPRDLAPAEASAPPALRARLAELGLL
ncbi:MAG: DUF1489 domain-containing protein [Parvularculaceae bacterium]|nr:DUF1489 domain-containing protein [Parvularculaceae bacterium]